MERFWRALGFDYTRRVHAKRMISGTDWLFWLVLFAIIIATVLVVKHLG